MKLNQKATVSTIIAATLIASSCGKKSKNNDSDNDDSTTSPNGQTSENEQLHVSGTIALSTGLTATKNPTRAVAIPLSNGAVDPRNITSMISATVETDGSFDLSLTGGSSTSDYVLLMLDTTKAAGEQFVNFIGLPSGDSNLLNLPVPDTKSSLDLGTVTPDASSPDAKATTTAQSSAATLGISEDEALQFADTGSVVRSLKNVVANCGTEPGSACVSAQTTFNWQGKAGLAVDDFNQASAWTYDGYSFILGFENTSYKFSDICVDGNPIKLTFKPPVDLVGKNYDDSPLAVSAAIGVTNNSLTTIATNSSGRQCNPSAGTTGIIAYIGESGASKFNFIPFSGASLTEAIPSGDWTLSVTGSNLQETYKFDLASASPIDSSGVARVWVPSIKLTKDSNDIITKVEVKFYTYNKSKGWVETTDTDALLAAVGGEGTDGNTGSGGIRLSFDDSGQTPRLSEMVRLTKTADSNIFSASNFTNSWHMPLASAASRPASGNYPSLRVDYLLRGTQLNFSMDRLD